MHKLMNVVTNTLRGALSLLAGLVLVQLAGVYMLWEEPGLVIGFIGISAVAVMILVGAYDIHCIIVRGETRDPC